MTDRRPAPAPHPTDAASASTVEVLHLTAFADGPGGGNPAGVVLDAATLSAVDMLRIAAQVGHAETAFVVDASVAGDDRRVAVRYFSPGAEVPFCGHATIATAVALAERRGVGPFTLDTAVGPVVIATARGAGPVEAVGGAGAQAGAGAGADADADADAGAAADAGRDDGTGVVTASFTSVVPVVRDLEATVADRLLALLGLTRADLDDRRPLRESFAGNRHPIVAVRELGVFDGFGFEPAALRALMDEQGWAGTVTVFCDRGVDESGATVVEARNLFPVGAITEDPATGSAAASLGGYLRALDLIAPPARVVVRQGRHVGRPSVLVVDVPVVGGITVTGTATPMADAPAP
ncbi:PhzF family phenazine biosynthesis protein [Frigoribacterium sp. VKM Ac-1396]|uniref:PhzF family phenazine biosynthesis protein n=1 Tax=Frigoribacterium sp. VKM Ac-1396 TaxID=2783821 RepID=UPI00188CE11E|nr:PhzF family phenazine biosynthesis protein [Frigoribacterium sp. VKM Ac-1396]